MGGGLVLVLVAIRCIRPASGEAEGSYPHEDRHKAPASAHPRPLSLQDEARLIPPHAIVNIHQDEATPHYTIRQEVFHAATRQYSTALPSCLSTYPTPCAIRSLPGGAD